MSALLDKLRTSTRLARRVPVEMALGVLVAISGSLAIEHPDAYGPGAAELIFAAVLTLIGVLGVSAFYEFGGIGQPMRWGLTVVVLGAGGAYGALVLDVDVASELWRWQLLLSGGVLGVMALPWFLPPNVGAPRSTEAWLLNVRMGIRVIVAGLYSGALSLGTILGVMVFNSLFELGFSATVYAHIATWIFAVGGVGLVATGLPDLVDEWSSQDPVVSELQKRVVYGGAAFLAMPLLGLYLVILYAYGGKILMTGEVPSNLLSPLALGAALIGLITLFLIEPLRDVNERKWLGTLFDAFPVAYLPLLPMPAWALWVRIQQHGWTEFRYVRVVAVLGITLCFGWIAWHVLRRRAFSALPLPAVFGVLFLLGAVGPWGALSVSERSQVAHLRQELSASSAAAASRDETRADAHRRVRYLFEHFGPQSLRPLLDTGQERPASVADAQEALGVADLPDRPRARVVHLTYDGPVSVPAAGTVHSVGTRGEDGERVTMQAQGLSLILFTEWEGRDTLSIEDRLPRLPLGGEGRLQSVPESDVTFRVGSSAARLVLRRLVLAPVPNSDPDWHIQEAEGVLFRPKDSGE